MNNATNWTAVEANIQTSQARRAAERAARDASNKAACERAYDEKHAAVIARLVSLGKQTKRHATNAKAGTLHYGHVGDLAHALNLLDQVAHALGK